MFLELNLFDHQNRNYQYQPVPVHDPDAGNDIFDIRDHDANSENDTRIDVRDSEIADIWQNVIYIHNKKFDRLQIDLFHSTIMHLSTKELTNCLCVSKYWNKTLTNFREVSKILQYNHFCVRRVWKSPIDYPRIISRLHILPKVSQNPIERLQNYNNYIFWTQEWKWQKNLTEYILPTSLFLLSTVGLLLFRPMKIQSEDFCLSIFNTTKCDWYGAKGFDGFRDFNPQLNQTLLSSLSLIEQDNIVSFRMCHKTTFVSALGIGYLTGLSYEFKNMCMESEKLIPIYFTRPEEKEKYDERQATITHFFVFYMSCSIFLYLIIESKCQKNYLDEFSIIASHLSTIYNLSSFIYCKNPFLIRKLKKNASEKMEKIHNTFQLARSSCYYKHRLIKRLANNGLTKIKNTFESITSFFSRISAPHFHGN